MLKRILPILVCVGAINAQNIWPITKWSKAFGGPSNEIGYAACPTSDSGVIIAGSTESYGNGGKDIILSKLNKDGVFQWYKTYGTSTDEEVFSAVETEDGGIIATGFSIVDGNRKLQILKTGSSGTYEWSKTYNFLANSEGYTIKKALGSGYIIAGKTFRGSEERAILLRISTDGTKLWSLTNPSPTMNSAYYDVIATDDNRFVAVGYTRTKSKMSEALVSFVNSNGLLQNEYKYGGSFEDKGFSITSADFGYMIAGYTNSYGNGGFDGLVLRLNFDGSIINYKTSGYKCDEKFFSISKITNNKFVISGNTKSYGNKDRELTIAILDSTGKVSWSNQYHGVRDSIGTCLNTISDSSFVLSSIYTQPVRNDKDFFVFNVKYSTVEQNKPTVIYPFTQRFRCVSTFDEIGFVTGNDSAYWALNAGEEALESTSPGGVPKMASILTKHFVASRDSGELMVDFILKFPTEIGPKWQANNLFTITLCDSANIPLYTFYFRPNGTEQDFDNWDMRFEKNSKVIAETNSHRLTRHGANADWVNFRIGLSPQGKITLYYDAKDGRGIIPHLVTTDRSYMNFYRMGLTFKTGVSDDRNYKILTDEITISMKYDYTTPTANSIMGFENGWYSSVPGSVSLDSLAYSEGNTSLKVNGSTLNQLTSALISSKKIGLITNNVVLDVNNGLTQNTSWYGSLQFFISCPSAGYSNKLIGQYELSQNPLGVFSPVTYTIPNSIVQKLNAQNYNDLSFRFYLSSTENAGPYYLDNMRFVNP